jgi:putative phosphoesterase
VDTDAWAKRLPETMRVTIGGATIYVLHDLAALDMKPHAHGIRVVVYGHSHKPSVTERDGVLYVNPGSAGPRRFRLPVTAAELLVDGSAVSARIQELAAG